MALGKLLSPTLLHKKRLSLQNDSLLYLTTGRLLLKDKEYRQNKADKAGKMVPTESLVLHYHLHDNRKDSKRHNLLNDFKFPNRERTTILCTTKAICRHHKAIFEESHEPAYKDYCYQAKALESRFKHHLTIPGQGHKQVRADQKSYCRYSFSHKSV